MVRTHTLFPEASDTIIFPLCVISDLFAYFGLQEVGLEALAAN